MSYQPIMPPHILNELRRMDAKRRGYRPLPTPIGPVPFWRKWWSWFHRIGSSPAASTGAR